jgi:1-acyl-sn-glycerol-3-phosphate acyltransferase
MFELDIRWQGLVQPGPKLIVANHPSCTDPFLLSILFPQPISILITDKAFAIPLFGTYLRWLRNIPVDTENGRPAFEAAQQLLERGRSVALFPEGWISPQEGGFNSPRTGAARLALHTGVPVVPVGIYLQRERNWVVTTVIDGRDAVGYWYLRGPYNMTVGQPICFSGDANDRSQVATVSNAIMHQITSLASESEQRTKARALRRVPVRVTVDVPKDRFHR